MSQLDQLAYKHPLATGFVGGAGTVFSWLMENLDHISRGLAVISQVVGLGIGCISLALLIRRWRGRNHFTPPHDNDDYIP